MKIFLGIINKKKAIDPYTLDKINITASHILPCTPGKYTSEIWQSPSKRIILCSFTNQPLVECSTNLWSAGGNALTFTGYINGQLNRLSYILLKRCWDESARKRVARSVTGQYSACFVDGDKDIITVWNNVTRIEPVYWAESSEFIVVSTRALLAHLLCENRDVPNYEILNLGYFINRGYYSCEYTPFKGVNILSPNSILKINSQGVKVEPLVDLEEEEGLMKPDDGFYDEITETFVDSLLPIKKHNVEIDADLTGGKDSRLIAAGLKYINADFHASTSGFLEHPDVVVAGMVANALNIPHNVNIPAVSKTGPEEYLTYDISKRARDVLFVTEGMVSAYENIKRLTDFSPNTVKVGGNGGEILRGGYGRRMKTYDTKHIKDFFFKEFLPHSVFINNEPLKAYKDDLYSWIDAQPNWLSPGDIATKYYLYYNFGRLSASARSGTTTSIYLYQPFFDSGLVTMAEQIHYDYKANEELVYNMLKRLAPELIDIPFYKQRWRFESNRPKPGEEDLWQRRTPITGVSNTKSTFNWRNTCLSDMKDVFYDQIFNSSSSEGLFQIVKREAVKQLFDSPPQLDSILASDLLWNLYSVSVLLSNEWLNDTGGSNIVKVKVPV